MPFVLRLRTFLTVQMRLAREFPCLVAFHSALCANFRCLLPRGMPFLLAHAAAPNGQLGKPLGSKHAFVLLLQPTQQPSISCKAIWTNDHMCYTQVEHGAPDSRQSAMIPSNTPPPHTPQPPPQPLDTQPLVLSAPPPYCAHHWSKHHKLSSRIYYCKALLHVAASLISGLSSLLQSLQDLMPI